MLDINGLKTLAKILEQLDLVDCTDDQNVKLFLGTIFYDVLCHASVLFVT